MKILGKVFAVSCVSVAATSVVVADEKAHDFYFQQNQQRFIVQPQNARMFGMGGSTALTASNSLSTVNNPAGLGMMKYGEVSGAYGYNEITGHSHPKGGDVKDKQNSGQVYGATPLGPVKDGLPDYGNFGLGWYGRNGDWRGDPTNTDTGTFQVSGGYGKAISEAASLGYSLTYQGDSVDFDNGKYDSSTSFLHNVGLQVQESKDLVLGGNLTFGHGKHDLEGVVADQSVDQFSVGVGGGAEYAMAEATSLGFGVDYTYYDNDGDNNLVNRSVWGGDSTGHAMNARLGLEQRLAEWFAVRGGYRYAANFDWNYDRAGLSDLNGSAKYNAWSLGAGINYAFADGDFIRAIAVDYGVEYRDVGNNDWQHLVSVAAPFDLCL
jgi:acyl-CoA-binding protein